MPGVRAAAPARARGTPTRLAGVLCALLLAREAAAAGAPGRTDFAGGDSPERVLSASPAPSDGDSALGRALPMPLVPVDTSSDHAQDAGDDAGAVGAEGADAASGSAPNASSPDAHNASRGGRNGTNEASGTALATTSSASGGSASGSSGTGAGEDNSSAADGDEHGELSMQDIRIRLGRVFVSPADAFRALDAKPDNMDAVLDDNPINEKQFIQGTRLWLPPLTTKQAKAAFASLDVDGDGELLMGEFMNAVELGEFVPTDRKVVGAGASRPTASKGAGKSNQSTAGATAAPTAKPHKSSGGEQAVVAKAAGERGPRTHVHESNASSTVGRPAAKKTDNANTSQEATSQAVTATVRRAAGQGAKDTERTSAKALPVEDGSSGGGGGFFSSLWLPLCVGLSAGAVVGFLLIGALHFGRRLGGVGDGTESKALLGATIRQRTCRDLSTGSNFLDSSSMLSPRDEEDDSGSIFALLSCSCCSSKKRMPKMGNSLQSVLPHPHGSQRM